MSELWGSVFHGQPRLELDDSVFSVITDSQTDRLSALTPAAPRHLWPNSVLLNVAVDFPLPSLLPH